MKNIRTIICGAMTALMCSGLSSCDSFLKEYSQDLAKVTSWEDLDEVLLGSGYINSGRIYIANSAIQTPRDADFDIIHMMGDEIIPTEENYTDNLGYQSSMFAFYTWQHDTGLDDEFRYTGGDESYWNIPYERINVCNMVISLIDEQPAPREEDAINKRRVKGEAYFLRGLFYFFLTNLYAEPYNPSTAETTPGVPLKFTEYVEDTEFSRASLKETYEKIIEDLEMAENYLTGTTRKSIYHADAVSARLLLSRVYLYMQNWEKAKEYASLVLGDKDGLLNLASKQPGEDCLSASSPETIFSTGDYMISATFADRRGYNPAWVISDDMLALFDKNDLRSTRYIIKPQYGRQNNVFGKVNGQRDTWGKVFEVGSVFTFRTPEAYLNLAEASAYSGDESTAQNILKRFVTTRINNPSVTETGTALVERIRDERAREFLLEGHRWFDLRRYSVCEVHPWSKVIEHPWHYRANYKVSRIDWYRLEQNDKAYTLPLPRKIKDFQNTLGSVNRPTRSPFQTTAPSNDDDDWDDWD